MRTISGKGPLRGEITVPGDKSISHRGVMFGALAEGTTEIRGFLPGADCLSTIDCFRRMGVSIDLSPDGRSVRVEGKGLRGLQAPGGEVSLYTGNSGTTTRILAGILAPQSFTSLLTGDASIEKRPIKRIMDPLLAMGADIVSVRNNGCAPLKITGRPLTGIRYLSPVASAQVKSCVLCAGLYAREETILVEPALSRDHTERMLTAFGASVSSRRTSRGFEASIQPCQRLEAGKVLVPGDISSAAYFLAAASLVPGSEVLIRGAGINPTRTGVLKAALAMGADIRLLDRSEGAEPSADLLVRHSSLKGTVIEGDIIPALIDELPVLAVMAAFAEGTTLIRDAAELRVKETDRIAAVTEGLRAMGAGVTPTDDGMIIEGGRPLHGALIHTCGDHRLAMSFAVAGLLADGETILDDDACVSVSYPSFFSDLAGLTS